MIAVRFVGLDGTVTQATATPGARLLDVAQACGQPLEGTCDGQMACSTCHVWIDAEDFARLPAASLDEEDLLDFAQNTRRTSRLACQIMLSPEFGLLVVHLPGKHLPGKHDHAAASR